MVLVPSFSLGRGKAPGEWPEIRYIYLGSVAHFVVTCSHNLLSSQYMLYLPTHLASLSVCLLATYTDRASSVPRSSDMMATPPPDKAPKPGLNIYGCAVVNPVKLTIAAEELG